MYQRGRTAASPLKYDNIVLREGKNLTAP